MNAPFCILTIAGSDSGGGAGIQADQRTIRALGGHALTAVTAVTAQDATRVLAWKAVAPSLVKAQIQSSLRGFKVAAIKTGLLPGTAAIRAVASALAGFPDIPLVVDPVIGSTSGSRFLPASALQELKTALFPKAALVTPNWPEAEMLTGRRVESHEEAEKAALMLALECGRPVLVKGGHAPRGPCRDCLALPGGGVVWFENRRISTTNTHGTGCVLSSAIASWLGRGASLTDSVRFGEAFLQRALTRGSSLNWGKGRGPAFFGSR
jgi:hydroxymethylpyrimidine/phosphomethylpyrimidine kinase